jgi:hypothetical protein
LAAGAALVTVIACAADTPAPATVQSARSRSAPPADAAGTPCALTAPLDLKAVPAEETRLILHMGDSIAAGAVLRTPPATSDGTPIATWRSAYRLVPGPALEWRAGYLRALREGTATLLWCPISPSPMRVPAAPIRQITVIVRAGPSA